MASNFEVRLERALTQIESLDNRVESMQERTRADVDELKLMIDKFTRETSASEKTKAEKWEAREEKMNERVKALEFWRWMLFGAFSVMTVFGSMAWYFTSNLMLDEIRNIRQHMNIPAPVKH